MTILDLLSLARALQYSRDGEPIRKKMAKERLCGKRIQQRLVVLLGQDHAQSLFDALKKDRGILAGGFVLQCILDADWQFSDLDLWRPCPETPDAGALVNWIRQTSHLNNDRDGDATYFHIPMLSHYFQGHLRNGRTTKIDLMNVEAGWSTDQVVQHFDLSCCRVTFNGQALVVHDVDAILTKTVAPLPKPSGLKAILRQQLRIQKYTKRGFTIPGALQYKRVLHINVPDCLLGTEQFHSYVSMLSNCYQIGCRTNCCCRQCLQRLLTF